MWNRCIVCDRQYLGDNITDTKSHIICPECYRLGYRLELTTTSTTKADEPWKS